MFVLEPLHKGSLPAIVTGLLLARNGQLVYPTDVPPMNPRVSAPKRHYTDMPSALSGALSGCGGVLVVQGGGFLTPQMVEETLPLASAAQSILIDLREVSGYDAGCVRRADDWISMARRLGVRRIAFVASSLVLRIAAQMVARRAGIDMRAFEDEAEARRWLGEAMSAAHNSLDA